MTVFADTFYFLALLSARDSAHHRAVQFTYSFTGRLLTTAWIITEVADGMTTAAERARFVAFFDRLTRNAPRNARAFAFAFLVMLFPWGLIWLVEVIVRHLAG